MEACSANTLYRKIKTNIPRNETARSCSQFLHSCICERRSFGLFCCRKRGGLIVGIYKPHTYTVHKWRNWERFRGVSFLGIHKSDLVCSVTVNCLCESVFKTQVCSIKTTLLCPSWILFEPHVSPPELGSRTIRSVM